MTRRLILISLLVAMAACSAAPPPTNVTPEPCPKPKEEVPIDGGLGGTGVTDEACAEEKI